MQFYSLKRILFTWKSL